MEREFEKIIQFIRNVFGAENISLHEPCFCGNEKKYVIDVIESTFVSSVGEKVTEFEQKIASYTSSKYAVAVVNGTSALHLALRVAGVGENDEVITQALSFVATANAIRYLGAHPIFLDVTSKTMSLDPEKVYDFLSNNVQQQKYQGKKVSINKLTGRRIAACLPVHVLGHPARIDEIVQICDEYSIPVIEDASESLGTFYKGKHTGTFGLMGVLSFNGNKIITTGSGGMILTNDKSLAVRARHLSTQAKQIHPWEYIHDDIGYNYRLSNLQAALGLAQVEKLDFFVDQKRKLAQVYKDFFDKMDKIKFFEEPEKARSNYWLNAILLPDLNFRDKFLKLTNTAGVMTRPVWRPLHKLVMFKNELAMSLEVTENIYKHAVCLPSSVIKQKL